MGLSSAQNGSQHLEFVARGPLNVFTVETMHALMGDVGIRLGDLSTQFALLLSVKMKYM